MNVVIIASYLFLSRLRTAISVIKLGTKNMLSSLNDVQNKPPCHNPSEEVYGTCRTGTIVSYVRNVERYVPVAGEGTRCRGLPHHQGM